MVSSSHSITYVRALDLFRCRRTRYSHVQVCISQASCASAVELYVRRNKNVTYDELLSKFSNQSTMPVWPRLLLSMRYSGLEMFMSRDQHRCRTVAWAFKRFNSMLLEGEYLPTLIIHYTWLIKCTWINKIYIIVCTWFPGIFPLSWSIALNYSLKTLLHLLDPEMERKLFQFRSTRTSFIMARSKVRFTS